MLLGFWALQPLWFCAPPLREAHELNMAVRNKRIRIQATYFIVLESILYKCNKKIKIGPERNLSLIHGGKIKKALQY